MHLPQHGVDASDSGPLQDFLVRDPVFPSQFQYSAVAAEMEAIQLSGLAAVYGMCQLIPDRSLVASVAASFLDACYATQSPSDETS
ncbi:unnamed protein product [Schistocephalus solidus]|uniref:Uncharacterized protein n=1 Tax=Schistocephalus solidus TaxID=70667 RepID=A0A3P7DLZ7_SCHSO|nr:unnamed protein product [Schistocephalus solidus]